MRPLLSSRSSASMPLACAAARPPHGAANDDLPDAAGEPLLRAALRLATAHGRGAARHAHRRCEQAFFAGQSPAYRWWLDMTRTLDGMIAAESPPLRASATAQDALSLG